MKDRLHLTYEPEKVPAPIVCKLAKRFEVEFSIRRANVELTAGWLDLSIEGDEDEIERAVEWLRSQGVRVDPVGGDVIEG